MRWISAFLMLGLGTVPAAWGEKAKAEGALVAPTSPRSSSGDSSAPSVAQQNGGAVDSTAITEATEAGRQIAVPTADRPAYVVTYAKGQHDFGSVLATEKTAAPEALDQQMERALAQQHYLRADASHPPAYLMVFTWGSHRAPIEPNDETGYRNLLDRAALVGGNGFASELKKVLEENQTTADATSTRAWGAQLPGYSPVSAASIFQSVSPIERFRRRNQKTEDLLIQVSRDCYYVLISAFDYASVGKGKSQLLWRTKLTTTAPGNSLAEAIPTLIANGGGYFGRSMTEAELFSSH